MTLVSVVTSLLNEEDNILPFYERISSFAEHSQDLKFEFVFVNDGSTDNSMSVLRNLARNDSRVKVVSFSRNFGSHAGIRSGFRLCTGDAAVTLSTDMQEELELLEKMIAKWQEGAETVFGKRQERDDHLAIIIFARLFYFLFKLTGMGNMSKGGYDVCLIDRKVIDAINKIGEKNTSILSLILWSGFRQAEVSYKRTRRKRGRSKWTLSKKIKMAVDSFVSFSFFPIRLVSCLGIVLSVCGLGYGGFLTISKLLYGSQFPGYTSLIVAMIVLSGLQMLMLGVVAEYLWRALDEARSRPYFIIDELIGFDDTDS